MIHLNPITINETTSNDHEKYAPAASTASRPSFLSHKWIEPNIVGSYFLFDEIVENTADV
jgi:hypothetical protein